MRRIKFSVIIPVYNAEVFIEECIESILYQSYKDVEVIVVDDGSVDNSLPILMKLAEEDPRLIVLSQENCGPSVARNKGIANSTGEYIGFLDADDWLENNAYQILYDNIIKEEYPDIIMFNNYVNDDKKKKPLLKSGLYDKDKIRLNIYPRLIESIGLDNRPAIRSSVWLRLYKRDIIFDRIWFKEELKNNEDLVFNFEATLNSNSFLYLGNSYLYHNRMTKNSISRGYMDDSYEKMKPLFNILTEKSIFIKNYDFTYQIKGRVFRTLRYCIENECRKDNPKTFIGKYWYIRSLLYKSEFTSYLSNYFPNKEKSKILYYIFYRIKFVLGLLLLAKYKVKQQEKRITYV